MQFQLISECFSKESKNVVIVGNWSRFYLKDYYNQSKNLTFALFDVNCTKDPIEKSEFGVKLFENYPAETFFQLQPTEYFFIVEIDLSFLKLALQQLKESIWWNVYGFFTIQRIYLNSCDEAYENLKIAWNFNILSVIFVCMDVESKIRVHTFNPYSDHASNGWIKYKSILQSNGHPLVLFQQYLTEVTGKLS